MLKGAGKKSDDDFIFDLDLSGEETGGHEAEDESKDAFENTVELKPVGEEGNGLPNRATAPNRQSTGVPAVQSTSLPIAIERKFSQFILSAKQEGIEGGDDEDDEVGLEQGTPATMFAYHLQQSKSVNNLSCSPPGVHRRVIGERGKKK